MFSPGRLFPRSSPSWSNCTLRIILTCQNFSTLYRSLVHLAWPAPSWFSAYSHLPLQSLEFYWVPCHWSLWPFITEDSALKGTRQNYLCGCNTSRHLPSQVPRIPHLCQAKAAKQRELRKRLDRSRLLQLQILTGLFSILRSPSIVLDSLVQPGYEIHCDRTPVFRKPQRRLYKSRRAFLEEFTCGVNNNWPCQRVIRDVFQFDPETYLADTKHWK